MVKAIALGFLLSLVANYSPRFPVQFPFYYATTVLCDGAVTHVAIPVNLCVGAMSYSLPLAAVDYLFWVAADIVAIFFLLYGICSARPDALKHLDTLSMVVIAGAVLMVCSQTVTIAYMESVSAGAAALLPSAAALAIGAFMAFYAVHVVHERPDDMRAWSSVAIVLVIIAGLAAIGIIRTGSLMLPFQFFVGLGCCFVGSIGAYRMTFPLD